MIIHRSLAAGVGLAALATSAFAQSSTPTAEEIAALRAQVQALSARLEQLEAQSQVQAQTAAAAPAAAGTPAPVAAAAP
ncbi:MAG: porin, partial [Alphaproteobacteria bacterium]|nr:porin [Alphaproteobacteria bacterium]